VNAYYKKTVFRIPHPNLMQCTLTKIYLFYTFHQPAYNITVDICFFILINFCQLKNLFSFTLKLKHRNFQKEGRNVKLNLQCDDKAWIRIRKEKIPVLWIPNFLIGFNADPESDPDFYLKEDNEDPDLGSPTNADPSGSPDPHPDRSPSLKVEFE
jgi:hypothetical protein